MNEGMSDENKRALNLLASSIMTGNLGLVKTKRRSDGTEVTLIVARVPLDSGDFDLAPIAIMLDGGKINDEYLTLSELNDGLKKEEMKKDIFTRFIIAINRLIKK
jgi:hypothetical protein